MISIVPAVAPSVSVYLCSITARVAAAGRLNVDNPNDFHAQGEVKRYGRALPGGGNRRYLTYIEGSLFLHESQRICCQTMCDIVLASRPARLRALPHIVCPLTCAEAFSGK